MKNLLLALGITTIMTPAAFAQHQHNYNKSVFNDYRYMAINKTGAAQTKEKVVQAFPKWVGKYDHISGMFTNIYGPGIVLNGKDIVEKAEYCIAERLQSFGINRAEWKMTRNSMESFASFVDYEQMIDGHAVYGSRLGFRFSKDGKLVSVKLKNYGTPAVGMAPSISATHAEALPSVTEGLDEMKIEEKQAGSTWVWFPIPTSQGYVLHPAYQVTLKGADIEAGLPVMLECFVDATNGKLLLRNNMVHNTVDVKMTGEVYKTNRVTPATIEPLADMEVVVGGSSFFTDLSGFASTTVTGPANADLSLRGRWVVVRHTPTGGTTPVINQTLADGLNTIQFPLTNGITTRHVNAYYHTNRIHDFFKVYFPTFTDLDFTMPANVDATSVGGSTSCNAFYVGGTINFLAPGGGCPSFAEIGDIVYHEYGHGINEYYYTAAKGSRMRNGSLNEGYADVWGMGITNDGVLGRNAMGNNSDIRRYDQAPKVYPKDIRGEVHADGEIIAGAWYDVAINLNDWDLMMQLFAKTYPAVPDGPLGTEGDIYFDVLLAALEGDDNDADITNGTPNMTALLKAFGRHGIYLFMGDDAVLTHTEINHQPLNAPISVGATLLTPNESLVKELLVYFHNRTDTSAAWDSLVLTKNGTAYSGQLPAVINPSVVDYYLELRDKADVAVMRWPAGYDPTPTFSQSVTIPYQFGAGIVQRLKTDFETPATGWAIPDSNGTATNGIWIQAVPVGTKASAARGGGQVQTGNDHTTGSGQCLVTGNGTAGQSAERNNVDGGSTTAMSDSYDLTGFAYPVVEYYRWYTNNAGSNPNTDYWQVQARLGTSTFWRNIDYTTASDATWRRRLVALKDIFTNPGMVQFRFVATDRITSAADDGVSVVEAAVDDFAIYDIGAASVGEMAAAKATIYPNPASESLFIELPAVTEGELGLYDVTGKAIVLQALRNNGTKYQINTSAIPAGSYFVKINAKGLIQVQKVAITH